MKTRVSMDAPIEQRFFDLEENVLVLELCIAGIKRTQEHMHEQWHRQLDTNQRLEKRQEEWEKTQSHLDKRSKQHFNILTTLHNKMIHWRDQAIYHTLTDEEDLIHYVCEKLNL